MTPSRIVMLGDSLTAGFGLRPEQALPAQLEQELKRLGWPSIVINAGVSGDTVADGLRRMDRAVPAQTDLCIVCLGANDMMQMAPVGRIRAELSAILVRLAARNIAAMVCGMRAPPWFGAYAVAFDRLFGEVALAKGAALDPFLLDGVALNPAYALADRIHPNEKGIEIVARRLAPHVRALLQEMAAQP